MDEYIKKSAALDAADSIINRDTSGNNDVVRAMTAWKEYIKALPSAQPDIPGINVIIDTIKNAISASTGNDAYMVGLRNGMRWCLSALIDKEPEYEDIPSAQPESCEYYALCRHGRDENKLRARLGFCEYCNEDADGYVKPIEKNCHAFIRFGMNGWELSLKANGWHGSAKIRYCPMCGRDLYVKRGSE